MSKELLKDTKFKSEVKAFFSKNREKVLDIILFGSTVRGKEKPRDIDILLLFKDKKDIDASYELKKSLRAKGYDAEITDKAYKELFEESFKARESVLSEGYSLVHGLFLAQGLGYMSQVIFKYELKGFSKSNRMRFYYSLYGRNGQKGILEELSAVKFSETILMCPVQNAEKLKEYLENWKIKFMDFPALIPSRLKNII